MPNVDGWNCGTAYYTPVDPVDAIPPQVTPRVYLAGQAMAALLVNGLTPALTVAADAVDYADAVLARLKETE